MFFCLCSRHVEYNQKTMDKALKRVKEMKADMGGTEILEPLKHIYSQRCNPDHPRQVQHLNVCQTHFSVCACEDIFVSFFPLISKPMYLRHTLLLCLLDMSFCLFLQI